jgi:hypothetical protein
MLGKIQGIYLLAEELFASEVSLLEQQDLTAACLSHVSLLVTAPLTYPSLYMYLPFTAAHKLPLIKLWFATKCFYCLKIE